MKFSREQLNSMDKNVLVDMYISLQEQIAAQTEETKALRLQIEKLTEQIALMNSRAFSRKTEKKLTGEGEQLSFLDDVLNEAEATCRGQTMIEPEMDQVVVSEHTRRKRRGKREEDLSGYPVVIVEHALSEKATADFLTRCIKSLKSYLKHLKFMSITLRYTRERTV